VDECKPLLLGRLQLSDVAAAEAAAQAMEAATAEMTAEAAEVAASGPLLEE
jgi:hypothetical protein